MDDKKQRIEPLNTESVNAIFDYTLRLVVITYKGELTPLVTIKTYQWLGTVIKAMPVSAARGTVYDFRKVTKFDFANLSTARSQSQKLNNDVDVSKHPVALIVGSLYQQKMASIGMKISPQDFRKRVVKSEREALKFINNWNHDLRQHLDLPRTILTVYPALAEN